MRIAVIGSGIAGNGAALALSVGGHEVVVYEAANRPGGHSATVDIDHTGVPMSVDTGFIVYNEVNYPQFTRLLDFLGVATQPSSMSFSVSLDRGRDEWCGRDPGPRGWLDVADGLFAQRRNLVSPRHIAMLLEVTAFQKQAIADVRASTVGEGTLADYLARHGFSTTLRDRYLVPMGAAIWSTPPKKMLEFPARSFLEFFDNHFLLQWDRPRWRTVTGGSRSYVRELVARFIEGLRLSTKVTSVRRENGRVTVSDAMGGVETFDHAIIATRGPEALAMLTDADETERALLAASGTSANDVWLHRDESLMPKRKGAWAAWNFLRAGDDGERACAVTYWMNELQGLDPTRPVFVTLNPPHEPAPEKTFGRWRFDHPAFDAAALAARERLDEIQGKHHVWFCGAWTGHGFHEDGLVSGLSVARTLGCEAPWVAAPVAMAEAAE